MRVVFVSFYHSTHLWFQRSIIVRHTSTCRLSIWGFDFKNFPYNISLLFRWTYLSRSNTVSKIIINVRAPHNLHHIILFLLLQAPQGIHNDIKYIKVSNIFFPHKLSLGMLHIQWNLLPFAVAVCVKYKRTFLRKWSYRKQKKISPLLTR